MTGNREGALWPLPSRFSITKGTVEWQALCSARFGLRSWVWVCREANPPGPSSPSCPGILFPLPWAPSGVQGPWLPQQLRKGVTVTLPENWAIAGQGHVSSWAQGSCRLVASRPISLSK